MEKYRFETNGQGVELRCVLPYAYEFKTFCKQRWRDRPLLSIFVTEFKAYDEDYYREAITSGSITVSGQSVACDYVVRNGDSIEHRTVRHEPPVLNIPISIEFDLPNILVVCKPPSIPTHECGAYYHNSLIKIIESETGILGLRAIHRLDRVTSGLVVLAKNNETAGKLVELMKREECEKWYVAKVLGNFPEGEQRCVQAITCLSEKDGVYGIDPTGKASETLFYKESYFPESNLSVVRCRPVTGRTHQIRLHLQHLGFPIANDSCYGGKCTDPISVPFSGMKRIKLESSAKPVELEETRLLMIYLHAYRYKLTQNLDFSVAWPRWAQQDVSSY